MTKISQLPAAGSLTGTEQVPVVQGGVTVRAPLNALVGPEGPTGPIGPPGDATLLSASPIIATGSTTSRTLSARFADVVNVKDFGATGDGTTDDTAAIQAAINAATSAVKSLFLPKPSVTYRTTATLNFRNLHVDGGASIINCVHGAIGVILGGTATQGTSPDQNIGTVRRQSGQATTQPTVRVIGAKGQKIWVKSTPWVQLWADFTVAADGSTAYSTFYIDSADKLHLDVPATGGGWINENQFFLNRTSEIYINGNDFTHNHNKFYNGTMENTASINIQQGNDNKFYGMRFEAGPTTITFGASTQRNIIVNTWASSEAGGWPNNPLISGTVTNNGAGGNLVLDEYQQYFNSVVVAGADISDVVLNNRVAVDALTPTTRSRTLQRIVGANNVEVCVSDVIPVILNDVYCFLWEGADSGDTVLYRPQFYFYDKNMQPVASAAGYVSSSNITTVDTYKVRSGTGVPTGSFGRITSTAVAGAKWVRVAVLSSSSQLGNALARRVSALNWSENRNSSLVAPQKGREQAVPYLVSARPTQGYAPVGFVARKSDMTANYWCVASGETTLASVAASSAASIEVASAAGMLTTDLIGINTDDRETHWTTISSIAGTTIGLTVVLPAASALGSRVVYNRWKTETLTLA